MTTSERRKDKRVPIKIAAQLQTEDSVIAKVGCIIDLSVEGLGFETDEKLADDSEVLLSFNLPIEVQGRIVNHGQARGKRRYGIRLTRVEPYDRKRLSKFVQGKS